MSKRRISPENASTGMRVRIIDHRIIKTVANLTGRDIQEVITEMVDFYLKKRYPTVAELAEHPIVPVEIEDPEPYSSSIKKLVRTVAV